MKKESPLPKNTFYDINKLPKEYGILVFPISLARTENSTGQDPKQCHEYVVHLTTDKVSDTKIGLNMVYGDFLYLHSKEVASTLKQKFMSIVLNHKNAFQNIIKKDKQRFQIQHGFSFEVWNQLYLDYKGDFDSDFRQFKASALEDEKFMRYLQDDAAYCGRELTEEQLNFFLEEHFMFYLASKGLVGFPNDYIQGREEWVLWCYPGKSLKAQVYVYQLNPLRLSNKKNIYENCVYDLESKKLIDFTRIDLDTYNYKYE